MAEDMKMSQGRVVFDTLCKALDNNSWKYQKDEADLSIECSARGDDLPMDLYVKVDEDRKILLLLSNMPFVVSEDKRLDFAIAVSLINNVLVDGSFDFDIKTGHMFFRMTNSYIESVIGEDLINYMLVCSCSTIDEYNDKLFMLAKGLITIDKFIETAV